MTSVLDQPVRVNERAEALYMYVDGREVCVDITSGAPEDRKVVLEFLAQAQAMALALLDVTPVIDGVAHSPLCGVHGLGPDERCHYTCKAIGAVVRDSGMLR